MIIITSSQTGGHIYPAIALAQEQTDPVHIITKKSPLAATILKKYKIPFTELDLSPKNPFSHIKTIFQVRKFLKLIKAKKLIATGGFLTAPVIIAAKTLGLPIILYEQNALPGRVTRTLAPLATEIHTAFKESLSHLPIQKTILTPNPLRTHFPPDSTIETLLKEPLPNVPKLLIIGGSQGAKALNDFITANKNEFLNKDMLILHITGTSSRHTEIQKIHDKTGNLKIIQIPYVESIFELYKIADLVLCRAGATTCAELLHHKKPAILVPYPYAKDDHQRINAEAMTRLGPYTLMDQDTLELKKIQRKLNQPHAHHAPTN